MVIRVDIDFETGKDTNAGKVNSFSSLPEKLVEIFKAKGPVNYVKSSS